MELITAFLTGLFSGGIGCMAVQGGLLIGLLVAHKQQNQATSTQKWIIFSFILARLIGYSLLGAMLGWLGQTLLLNLQIRGILQITVSFFMIATAFSLISTHPVWRYLTLQPPRWVYKAIHLNKNKTHWIIPAGLGFACILLPCGSTQAMMAQAVTSASIWQGLLLMFSFTLGSSIIFTILTILTSKVPLTQQEVLNKVVAVFIVGFAIYNLIGGLGLLGLTTSFAINETTTTRQITSSATIYFTENGYLSEPKDIVTKTNSTLTLKLINQSGTDCIQSFNIPQLNISQTVLLGEQKEIVVTMPSQATLIQFMCSAGAYRGIITVL